MTVVFNGEFDRDILTYPELLTKAESTHMNTLCERIKKFTDSIDRKKIERNNEIDKETYQEMSKLKLYGLSIPEEFGKKKNISKRKTLNSNSFLFLQKNNRWFEFK